MKLCKRITAFTLSLLGVGVYARDLPKMPRNVKIVEGFELEDDFISVYGGPGNYITSKLCGAVFDKANKKPLKGIKLALYDGTNEMTTTFTDENGHFYFKGMNVWAGVGIHYTLIVSDPNNKFKASRRDVYFDTDEILKEELVALQLNSEDKKLSE